MFIVSVSLLAALSINSSVKRHFALALCIGLLFPVTLANGIIGCVFYLFYLFIDIKNVKTRFAFLAFALASGFLLLILSYLAAGLPLGDGFRGLSIHAKLQLGRTDTGLGLVLSAWRSWIIFAVLSVVYLIISLISVPAIRQSTTPVLDRMWLGSSFIFLAYSVYFFGLRAAPTNYNLYAFLPLYQFLSFRLLIDLNSHNLKILSYVFQGALVAGLLLSLLEPLRSAVLFPYYLVSGSTYSQAKNNFLALDIDECNLMHTAGLALLDESQRGSQFKVDDSSHFLISKRIKFSGGGRTCIAAIVQEINANSRLPVDMEMIADYSDKSPWTPRLRALRLLNSPKGYSFYAYKKEL